MMRPISRRAAGMVLLILAAAAYCIGHAGTATASECPTLFPDFSCDREARPAGSERPMSFPYLFEDPFITTELQFAGLWHGFPEKSVFQGGDAGVLAVQARVAITDRLAFIATKDGLTIFRPDTQLPGPGSNQVLEDRENFMDMTAGFKYLLVNLPEQRFYATPAFRYEIPLGSHDLFQGRGDGVLIPSVSAYYEPIENTHLIVGTGVQAAVDRDKNSSSIFYNLHLDHSFELPGDSPIAHITPFFSLSGMRWVDSGNGNEGTNTTLSPPLERLQLDTIQAVLGTGPFEGADVANLGSEGVGGENLVVVGGGVRMPIAKAVSLGVLYEHAVEGRIHIFQDRVTFMTTYEF